MAVCQSPLLLDTYVLDKKGKHDMVAIKLSALLCICEKNNGNEILKKITSESSQSELEKKTDHRC